jgi:predicted lipoprotein with Yx(FWY)xxD motif
MRRHLILLLAVAMVGASAGSVLAAVKRGTTIKLERTQAGKILTNSSGMTLYMFERDKRNKDVCVKIRDCLTIWPAVTTKAKPVAGNGVKASLLGTIKLPNGKRQVTYSGHPLYTYIGDSGPRDASYIGTRESGGTWWAVDAAGHVVKT